MNQQRDSTTTRRRRSAIARCLFSPCCVASRVRFSMVFGKMRRLTCARRGIRAKKGARARERRTWGWLSKAARFARHGQELPTTSFSSHASLSRLSLYASYEFTRTKGGSRRRQTATWRSRSRRAWPWLVARGVGTGKKEEREKKESRVIMRPGQLRESLVFFLFLAHSERACSSQRGSPPRTLEHLSALIVLK